MDDSDSDSSLSLHTIEDSEYELPLPNLNRPFDYILDWDSCPDIMQLVLGDDTDGVRQMLLKQGNAINSRDPLYNTPLHLAYLNENLDIIDLLVSHPDVSLESRNHSYQTPLLMSILGRTSDAVVMKLLDAGCNVNTKDSLGRTPLYAAINYQTTIVEELLKRGANVNTPCGGGRGCPALFYAIYISNLELLCMILHYNADVSIKGGNNMTPFLYSLNARIDRAFAYEILPYVVDFSSTNPAGLNCLSMALQHGHPIAKDILRVIDYESLNQLDNEGNSALYYSCNDASIYKELLLRIDHDILFKCRSSFLQTMLLHSICSISSWIECFYLLASSNIFPALLQDFISHLPLNSLGKHKWPLFTVIMHRFNKIPQIDRERIIYIFLSFGAEVFCEDISNYYKKFGPCSDLNILLNFKLCGDEPLVYTPFLSYIFGREERMSYTDLRRCLINELTRTSSRVLVNIFRFFTFSFKSDILILINRRGHLPHWVDLEQEKFQVPSLLELCRNEIRFKVRSDLGIKTANAFYEAVDKLVIPKKLKNLILFKIPLR